MMTVQRRYYHEERNDFLSICSGKQSPGESHKKMKSLLEEYPAGIVNQQDRSIVPVENSRDGRSLLLGLKLKPGEKLRILFLDRPDNTYDVETENQGVPAWSDSKALKVQRGERKVGKEEPKFHEVLLKTLVLSWIPIWGTMAVHEFGHSVAAKLLSVPVKKVVFSSSLPRVEYDAEEFSKISTKKAISIYLAGLAAGSLFNLPLIIFGSPGWLLLGLASLIGNIGGSAYDLKLMLDELTKWNNLRKKRPILNAG